MAVDWSEHWTLVDAASCMPGAERPDRAGFRMLPERDAHLATFAFLIGFATAELHPQSIGGLLEVRNVETNQLGAPEGPGETEQKQCVIARAGERVRRTRRH